MTLQPTEQEKLLNRLLLWTQQDRSHAFARFCAKNAHLLSAVNIDTTLIAVVLQGSKRVRETGAWIDFARGDIFLVPSARSLDIENIPDPDSGWYLAVGIAVDETLLAAARQLLRSDIAPEPGAIANVPIANVTAGLAAWLDATQCGDTVGASYALVGVVLKLHAMGHRGILLPAVATLGARIRAMVANEPAREWSSSEVEERLALSGATLRRKLAGEGTSLREIVADARLSYGLNLLLTKQWPVKTVAARVGYQSAASFTKRFTERYGVEPSRLSPL